MTHFKAIAAMADNRVIGFENRIPWSLPEDFEWFRKTTMGQVIVIGRRTFESIGKPLPGRATVVLSRCHPAIPGVRVISSLNEIDLVREKRDVFICGGAQVYVEALPLCSDLYLTLVKRTVTGDAFFPPFEDQFVPAEIILERPGFRITHYRNRTPAG